MRYSIQFTSFLSKGLVPKVDFFKVLQLSLIPVISNILMRVKEVFLCNKYQEWKLPHKIHCQYTRFLNSGKKNLLISKKNRAAASALIAQPKQRSVTPEGWPVQGTRFMAEKVCLARKIFDSFRKADMTWRREFISSRIRFYKYSSRWARQRQSHLPAAGTFLSWAYQEAGKRYFFLTNAGLEIINTSILESILQGKRERYHIF